MSRKNTNITLCYVLVTIPTSPKMSLSDPRRPDFAQCCMKVMIEMKKGTKATRKRRPIKRVTYTVPEAGKKLGIGRNSSYEAARKGQIPTIRIGNRLLVPIAAFHRMLG